MAQTANYGFEKPSTTKDVDEEFYQLQETLDLLDAILAALQTAVNGKSATGHTHAISDVVNLAAELAAKMPASTTFKLDDLTDVDGADSAPNNYVLVKSSLGWLPSSALAALGSHGHVISEITGLVDALSGKAQANNPAFTGTFTFGGNDITAELGFLSGVTSSVQTQLATKVSKSGDTMTGQLTVDYTNAAIYINGDNRQWYWQALENAGSPKFRLVDVNAGAEAFAVGTDGSIWCRQFGDVNARIEARAQAYGQSWSTVSTALSNMTAGGVGSLVLAVSTAAAGFGATVAGSTLSPTSVNNNNPGAALGGTWRCLGTADSGTAGTVSRTTLWLRIA